jgi:hypothetical protein
MFFDLPPQSRDIGATSIFARILAFYYLGSMAVRSSAYCAKAYLGPPVLACLSAAKAKTRFI